ncbi:MAG: hypothetical protein HDS11_04100 [Bacteroides sp.]|nr:hypothetical protein [Bacteroides sp.]
MIENNEQKIINTDELPNLEGSEKQVNWANDIREKLVGIVEDVAAANINDIEDSHTLINHLYEGLIITFLPEYPYGKTRFGFKTSSHSKEEALASIQKKRKFYLEKALEDDFKEDQIEALKVLYDNLAKEVQQVQATENTIDNGYALKKGLQNAKRAVVLNYAKNRLYHEKSASWWIDHRVK